MSVSRGLFNTLYARVICSVMISDFWFCEAWSVMEDSTLFVCLVVVSVPTGVSLTFTAHAWCLKIVWWASGQIGLPVPRRVLTRTLRQASGPAAGTSSSSRWVEEPGVLCWRRANRASRWETASHPVPRKRPLQSLTLPLNVYYIP